MALCGSASRSVSVVCRKEPMRVKLVPFSLNVTVTFSFSRACFFSRHIAKAHPTAWLSRSPCSAQQFIGLQKNHSKGIVIVKQVYQLTDSTTKTYTDHTSAAPVESLWAYAQLDRWWIDGQTPNFCFTTFQYN